MTDPRIRASVRYPNDLTVPGMWHARLVRSPHPAARVTGVDTSLLPPGVVVLTPSDVEPLGRYGCQISDQHVLAGVARHVGAARILPRLAPAPLDEAGTVLRAPGPGPVGAGRVPGEPGGTGDARPGADPAEQALAPRQDEP